MTKRLQTDEILSLLSKLRRAMPPAATSPAPPSPAERFETVEDFEIQTVLDTVEMVASELGVAMELARAKATVEALRIYYVAEELARDPAHANLIPHVEAMRRAYEKDHGEPIPARADRSRSISRFE